MISRRTLVVVFSGLWLSSPLLYAQEVGHYRDVHLGSTLLSVAEANGLTAADAKVLHRRPAILRDLEWRSRTFLSESVATTDPVREIVFSFYNDELFRVVANYDRQRTEGLTDADLIDAMTAAYGPPVALSAKKLRASEAPEDLDQGTVIARWEDAESTVILMRARYPTPVSLVVISKRLAGLARAADLEAIRLDRLEAPQREVDRLKKEADATRVSGEQARPANKAAFKP